MTAPLLLIENLDVTFPGHRRGEKTRAVRGVSMEVAPGEVRCIIGESGSGKSTVLSAIAGLLPPTAEIGGRMHLAGREGNLLAPGADRQGIAGRQVAMVFQNPSASLNPVLTIGAHVAEVIRAHHELSEAEVRALSIDYLDRVGLPDPARKAAAYPHQLSGGQKQRVAIAAAIAGKPSLLLADEPTTALDATVQAQILKLMLDLVEREKIAMIFVTHDLAVAASIADRIEVMRHGELLESGTTEQVVSAPKADYTRQLIAASLPFTQDVGRPTTSPARPRMGGLKLRGITRSFHSRGGGTVQAVAGVDLDVSPGEIVGLIGESGSGKSTLGRIAVGLTAAEGGTVELDGTPLAAGRRLPKDQRAAVQLVFQDPLASFNPRREVAHGLRVPLRIHRQLTGSRAEDRIAALFEEVGLAPELAYRRPQTLSGGQLQRAAIARSLATGPRVLVCDEAVASLDVSVRAQVLDLIRRLVSAEGLGVLFISHDLGDVQRIADRTVVLYNGRVVEAGATADVLSDPTQDYTRRLIDAVPRGLEKPGLRRNGSLGAE